MLRTDGLLEIGGQKIEKGAVLWQDTAPQEVEIRIVGDATKLEVNNAWDVGDGTIQSWHNGAAMIVEDLPRGRRYRCNDGHPDEDFDDLIFRIERL